MKIYCLWCFLFVIGALPVACVASPSQTPTQAREVKPTGVARSDWDELVAAAQKEGTVNIYAFGAVSPGVASLREAFKQKFGINLEFVLGGPSELQAKLTAERRVGLYFADVYHMGETNQTMDIKPLGITSPIADLLTLPGVKNPQNWIGGKVPFLDKETEVMMFTAMAVPHGVANSDIVKETEFSSFLDLLNPKWKGKIVFYDPTVSGTSANLMAALYKVYGKEKSLEAFNQLAALEPVITRDNRLMLEWIARGKYLVGLGQSMALLSEFRRAQAPIRTLNFKEPRFISGGPGNLSVFSNNPHPKATKVYVNWLLSKEGSSVWSKAMEYPSARLDVPAEGLAPDTVPRANDLFPDMEQMRLRLEMRKTAADIFGHLMR